MVGVSPSAQAAHTIPKRIVRTSTVRGDLLALALLGVLTFMLARRFDLFEHLAEGAQWLESVGIDDLIVAALVLGVGLKAFAWRRWREAQRALTAYARAEASLRRERHFADAVLETAGSLILVLDHRGHIVRFNRACESLTGYALAEVRDQPFWELLLIPEELVQVRSMFAELRAGRFPRTYESHWVTRDGQYRLIAWATTALTDAVGEVEYILPRGST